MLQLLTSKPVLYVCNVEEDAAAGGNGYSAKVAGHAAHNRRRYGRHFGQDRG